MKINTFKSLESNKTTYKTKQREFIINYFKKHSKKHITAETIIEYCNKKNIAISKATIYRSLSLLLKEGIINKYFVDEKIGSCYCLATSNCNFQNHYHLRCRDCDKIFHIDGLEFRNISKKLKKEFDFTIDISKTTLYGRCGDCSKILKGESPCL